MNRRRPPARCPDQMDCEHSRSHATLVDNLLKKSLQPMIYRPKRVEENEPSTEPEPQVLLQPETRPISHEQLVVEVKGIYAGLVLVEAKCIVNDERQSAVGRESNPSRKTELKNDQWQSLIALQKQLLYEHHDFFLASQHPSANQALSKLAAKYSMPARMWRHGIHAFLEILQHRLPNNVEHMLAFIYIVYVLIASLYETAPTFKDTWIECLGDLGRYRMVKEEDEFADREVWSDVSEFWHNKASDESPNVGRLHDHIVMLGRPNTIEQLLLYTGCLTCNYSTGLAEGAFGSLSALVVGNRLDYGRLKPNRYLSYGRRISSHAPNEAPLSEVAEGLLRPLHDILLNLLTGPHDRQIWEDYTMRMIMLGWSSDHWQYPNNLLTLDTIDGSEHTMGQESWLALIIERIMWLGLAVTPICLYPKTGYVLEIRKTLRRMYHDMVTRSVLLTTNAATSISAVFRRDCLCRRSTILAFISIALPSTGASPIGKPANGEGVPNVGLLPATVLGYSVVALAIVLIAQYLASRKGPIHVWGCVMAGSAYAWLMIRNDPTTTLALSTPVFGVWTISTLQYGYTNFRKFGIPDAVSLLVILAGTLINLSLVRFMTPTGATISQADLISVSLPSVSATLASIVNLVALIKGSVAQQRNLQSIDVPRTGDLSNSDDTDSGNTLMEHPATYLSELPGALYELPSTHGVLDEISVPRTAPSSIEYISTASMHYIWLTSTIEHCRTVYRRLTRSDTQN